MSEQTSQLAKLEERVEVLIRENDRLRRQLANRNGAAPSGTTAAAAALLSTAGLGKMLPLVNAQVQRRMLAVGDLNRASEQLLRRESRPHPQPRTAPGATQDIDGQHSDATSVPSNGISRKDAPDPRSAGDGSAVYTPPGGESFSEGAF
ncbi:hypothetical protein ACRS6B_19830 [Nocardia asteroides]